MHLRIFAALLLSFGLHAQGIITVPTNGATDTATSCAGIFVDGGGLNGNYGNYNDGYLIIDPRDIAGIVDVFIVLHSE